MLPLFKLPSRDVLRVLDDMHPFTQLAFSLLSKRCLSLIKSLNLRTKRIEFHVSKRICLKVCTKGNIFYFIHLFENQQLATPHPIRDTLNTISLKGHNIEKEDWTNLNMSTRDWIMHIMDIYHRPTLDNLYLSFNQLSMEPSGFFDCVALREIMTGIRVGSLYLEKLVDPSRREWHNIASALVPCNGIFTSDNPFRDLAEIQKIYIRNREGSRMSNKATLDDILSCNSSRIMYQNPGLTDKEVNKFLKLWSKGGNPYLTKFKCNYERGMEIDEMMKGIQCQDVRNLGKYRSYFSVNTVIRKVYFFYRRDKKAFAYVTFTMENGQRSLTMIIRHLF